MSRKSFGFRPFACLVLLSFLLTLLPASVLANPASEPEGSTNTTATGQHLAGLAPSSMLAAQYVPSAEGDILVVAHAAGGSHENPAAEKVKQESCCGDFWDVHFGGYRWAWWALAGAGLIAIHAN